MLKNLKKNTIYSKIKITFKWKIFFNLIILYIFNKFIIYFNKFFIEKKMNKNNIIKLILVAISLIAIGGLVLLV